MRRPPHPRRHQLRPLGHPAKRLKIPSSTWRRGTGASTRTCQRRSTEDRGSYLGHQPPYPSTPEILLSEGFRKEHISSRDPHEGGAGCTRERIEKAPYSKGWTRKDRYIPLSPPGGEPDNEGNFLSLLTGSTASRANGIPYLLHPPEEQEDNRVKKLHPPPPGAEPEALRLPGLQQTPDERLLRSLRQRQPCPRKAQCSASRSAHPHVHGAPEVLTGEHSHRRHKGEDVEQAIESPVHARERGPGHPPRTTPTECVGGRLSDHPELYEVSK